MKFAIWILLAFAADNGYQDVRTIVREEGGRVPGFVQSYKGGTDLGSAYVYSSHGERPRGARLLLDANRIPPDNIEMNWATATTNGAYPARTTLGSGFACGDASRFGAIGKSNLALSKVGIFIVTIQMIYRGEQPSTEIRNADLATMEGLLRRTLARCRGLQASTTSSIQLAGSSIACVTGPRGERLIDLARYCQALNLQLNTNHQLGTASFNWSGEMVVIPLAAKGIKDSGQWIESNDITLMKDGKWYASYTALQQARGQ
jgi:hypothetical protein